jgi:hypothetical protein
MHVRIHARTNVWVLQVAEGERRGLCAVDVCNIGADDQRRQPFGSNPLQQSRLCSREEAASESHTASLATAAAERTGPSKTNAHLAN